MPAYCEVSSYFNFKLGTIPTVPSQQIIVFNFTYLNALFVTLFSKKL